MRNERILVVDDDPDGISSMEINIKRSEPEFGHVIVATASSIEAVQRTMGNGLKPTLAVVDDGLPNKGDGQIVSEIIKGNSPETIVVSFSGDPNVRWGDVNWQNTIGPREFLKRLTELQH